MLKFYSFLAGIEIAWETVNLTSNDYISISISMSDSQRHYINLVLYYIEYGLLYLNWIADICYKYNKQILIFQHVKDKKTISFSLLYLVRGSKGITIVNKTYRLSLN